jgi:TolB-like protein/class 3 adenylate cyclase
MAREQRRLAGIVSADVVGYSRLMGRDESGTLAALKVLRRDVVDPPITAHGGRIVKTTGDGLLLDFPSVVDAVRCVVDIQAAMASKGADISEDRRIAFRIGVNLGDIIIDDDDIFGDGVNIAARLQEIASPGGICISSRVHDDVRDRLDIAFEDGGPQTLKNIARPVVVWRWSPGVPRQTPIATVPAPLALPDKPSIAVLAFANMSGDPEQEYFTDGITEDIITELSRFRSLFVIARNSSFSYKGKSPDIRQVGRELGVRYVLEGSIRKAANRIRVTSQLIDTLSGSHIWAERYDRVLEDVFAVQEELTQSIVRAIAPSVSDAEVDKLRRRRPDSLGSYEIAVRAYAKAWDAFAKSDRTLCDEAIGEARAALLIDPDSTLALNALALALFQHRVRGTAVDPDAAWREGLAAATRSVEVDRTNSFSHAMKGMLLMLTPDRIGEGLESARRAHDLNPHDMQSLIGVAFVENRAGDPERAIEYLQQAMRISPRDPMRPNIHQQLAMASFTTGQYAKGVAYALLGIDEAPRLTPLHVYLATNYVGLGEIEKAKAAMVVARRVGPEFVERYVTGAFGGHKRERQWVFARIAAGLEDPGAAEALR